MLDAIVVEPSLPAKASVIWLHGLGASGHDLAPIVPELGLPSNHRLRFIFPHAPHQPVTLNFGMSMPAWYDILGLGLNSNQDETGIRRAESWIHEWLDYQEALGIPSHQIALGGFSQGGALALHTGLRYPKRLAGILGLSTYLPIGHTLPEERSPTNQNIPIWMAHGTQDMIVAMSLADRSLQMLHDNQYKVDFRTYPMGHTICDEEMKAIGHWLTNSLDIIS